MEEDEGPPRSLTKRLQPHMKALFPNGVEINSRRCHNMKIRVRKLLDEKPDIRAKLLE